MKHNVKGGVFFIDSFDIGIPLILILSIKMVLFSISINLEPFSSNLEPVFIWPEVCSYIIGYVYNNIPLTWILILFNMCLFDLKFDISI